MDAATTLEAVEECPAPLSNVDQDTEKALAESKAEGKEEEEDDPRHSCSYVLYIGNLNPKYPPEILCNMLKDLLGMASVTLQRHHIEVVKKRRQAYAFIQVATEVRMEQVLKQLLLASDTEQELTKELVKKGQSLVVGQGKKFAFGEGRESDSVGSCSESPVGGLQAPEKSQKGLPKKPQTNSIRKSVPYPWRLVDRPVNFLNSTRSDSAIVQREIVGKECLFYGAFMGNETRNMEFKRGGGEYLTVTLKHHVRKYACAFLNSEGGSLFVGVEDNGLVRGVRCDHKDEDRVRLLIDSVLKGFKPQVFPAAYTLSFIPVIKAEDTGIFLKVIRLSIRPPQEPRDLLYETDQGEVYLRRDGSIQGPLTGSAIQEWCRQKWTEEIKKLEMKIEILLKEKETLQQYRQKNTRSACCLLM
ncbi:schlafen-like protein 1 isoform X2 [Sceloporus undulatus]|uniref:schlafen-like protein 1 isoform X2 n=1 Tax=Sceloporus undulatus TaxID=8520 RepID=UPI001C4CA9A1|nr:schlafen-like protein 1 isoform X2 [Sceloporus undulatus]